MEKRTSTGRRIFISAGEISGDMHGSRLIQALRKLDSNLIFDGLGGDQMAKEGMRLLFHCKDLAFMGFFEIIRHLPFIGKMFRNVRAFIDSNPPDAAILIDYPGFNLRLAKIFAAKEIPVFYYISPQLWAWGGNRVKKVKKYVKRMLCIFPFEPDWYAQHGVQADYVGHPLVQFHHAQLSPSDFFGIIEKTENRILIGIFPGSRQQEIDRHLQVMLDALEKVNDCIPLEAIIARAEGVVFPEEEINSVSFPLKILQGYNPEIQTHSDLVLTSSGTTTLETALAGTPMVVIYRVSLLTYHLGKFLIHVDNIAMANIIAGKDIVPELIQRDASPERISEEMLNILKDANKYRAIKAELYKIRDKLGEYDAPRKAAQIIMDNINEKTS